MAQEEKKLLSDEEINLLNKEADPQELEDFFYQALREKKSPEEARKIAKNWAYEMTKNSQFIKNRKNITG